MMRTLQTGTDESSALDLAKAARHPGGKGRDRVTSIVMRIDGNSAFQSRAKGASTDLRGLERPVSAGRSLP